MFTLYAAPMPSSTNACGGTYLARQPVIVDPSDPLILPRDLEIAGQPKSMPAATGAVPTGTFVAARDRW